MENIPKKYETEDMPIPASFVSKYDGRNQVKLLEVEHRTRPNGEDERIPGTGLTIEFVGGKYLVKNAAIFKIIMQHHLYGTGGISIDAEDPTGFWREADILKPETKEVIIADAAPRNPSFSEISKTLGDVKKMKKPEEEPQPLILN